MRRNIKFAKNGIFHICNKSISNFGIFKDSEDGTRFLNIVNYYNTLTHPGRFSKALKRNHVPTKWFSPVPNRIIKILSFCIMPDHYHLLIKILLDWDISKYFNDVENSFSRYFNIKRARKGPVWQSAFKAIRIESNELLLHVSRYIHLNPTTSHFVDKPENWSLSSYRDLLENKSLLNSLLTELSIKKPHLYKQFVENQIDYQRRLKHIKKFLLE